MVYTVSVVPAASSSRVLLKVYSLIYGMVMSRCVEAREHED